LEGVDVKALITNVGSGAGAAPAGGAPAAAASSGKLLEIFSLNLFVSNDDKRIGSLIIFL